MALTSASWTPLDVYMGKLAMAAVLSWTLVLGGYWLWRYFTRD